MQRVLEQLQSLAELCRDDESLDAHVVEVLRVCTEMLNQALEVHRGD